MKPNTNTILAMWKKLAAAGKLVSCQRVANQLETEGYDHRDRQTIRYHMRKTKEGRELLKTARPMHLKYE